MTLKNAEAIRTSGLAQLSEMENDREMAELEYDLLLAIRRYRNRYGEAATKRKLLSQSHIAF